MLQRPNHHDDEVSCTLLQATKERLLQAISLAGLPDLSQRAARFMLSRLDRNPKDAAESSLQCCAPLPPRLQPYLSTTSGLALAAAGNNAMSQ